MIYYLYEILKDFDFPGHGLLGYLSFRAIMAGVTAMLISFFAGRRIIRWLQKKQIGETIRDLGLEGQMQKKGTPTMGGIIILLAIVVSVLLFCDLSSIYTQLLLFTTLWCGGIGFADDYIKVFKKNKDGLSPKAKLILQFVIGAIVGLTVCFSSDIIVRDKIYVKETADTIENESSIAIGNTDGLRISASEGIKSTKTTIPFIKNHEFDYKWLVPFGGKLGWYGKWLVYALMIVVVVICCSNGTNLTDGMDGLAAGTSAIVGIVLGILAWLSGNIVNSDYLNILYIPGTGEVAIFMAIFVGSLLGFLWYNSYPAQVFMGDTGSLAIGGIIGVTAVLIRKELLLPLLCGIFVAESLSVIIQSAYFKYTRKRTGTGKRIFRMAPLHHHYQRTDIPALIKWPSHTVPEAKIVTRFWLIGLILAGATLALLKLR